MLAAHNFEMDSVTKILTDLAEGKLTVSQASKLYDIAVAERKKMDSVTRILTDLAEGRITVSEASRLYDIAVAERKKRAAAERKKPLFTRPEPRLKSRPRKHRRYSRRRSWHYHRPSPARPAIAEPAETTSEKSSAGCVWLFLFAAFVGFIIYLYRDDPVSTSRYGTSAGYKSSNKSTKPRSRSRGSSTSYGISGGYRGVAQSKIQSYWTSKSVPANSRPSTGDKGKLSALRRISSNEISTGIHKGRTTSDRPAEARNNKRWDTSPLATKAPADPTRAKVPSEQPRTAATFTGTVVGVHDGDTITVLVNNTPMKVRLAGIDAPEKGQAFAEQSKQALAKYVHGKTVLVEWSEKDKYGRTIGKVYIGGHLINLELVAEGHAWHYKQYSDDEELETAEELARIRGDGLWSDEHAIPPWDYRRK